MLKLEPFDVPLPGREIWGKTYDMAARVAHPGYTLCRALAKAKDAEAYQEILPPAVLASHIQAFDFGGLGGRSGLEALTPEQVEETLGECPMLWGAYFEAVMGAIRQGNEKNSETSPAGSAETGPAPAAPAAP